MSVSSDIRTLLHLTQAHGIGRRYFVANGFDGAMTMLGIIIAFYTSGGAAISVVISACLAAAIALFMSGLSSAYVSESAERSKALNELEQALLTDLSASEHGRAARLVPFMIAMVNGASPLLIGLFIMLPLWLALYGVSLPVEPLAAAVMLACVVLFLLGAFTGRISGHSWLWTGLRTLLIAIVTGLIIFAFNR